MVEFLLFLLRGGSLESNLFPFLFLALSIGFVHTLLGPDHYLPFIVLSKARNWSLKRTLWITFGCGVGHVLSSVVLGFLGIGFGWAVGELVAIEGIRGNVAGWLLLSFGVIYFVWGIKQGVLGKSHVHNHHHLKDSHTHDHSHTPEHLHSHSPESGVATTPWVLFLIFVFGPCEPLIPVLMYPAVQKDVSTLLGVVVAFGLVTILTMMGIVTLAYRGLDLLQLKWLEQWTHALAGGAITVVASGMVFLGW